MKLSVVQLFKIIHKKQIYLMQHSTKLKQNPYTINKLFLYAVSCFHRLIN